MSKANKTLQSDSSIICASKNPSLKKNKVYSRDGSIMETLFSQKKTNSLDDVSDSDNTFKISVSLLELKRNKKFQSHTLSLTESLRGKYLLTYSTRMSSALLLEIRIRWPLSTS